jgi:phosphoenolpyruvate carboxylase
MAEYCEEFVGKVNDLSTSVPQLRKRLVQFSGRWKSGVKRTAAYGLATPSLD